MSRSAGRSLNGTCSMFGSIGAERAAELRLGAGRERTVALAVKAFGRGDDRLLVRIVRAREFERGFDRLGAAVAEESELEACRARASRASWRASRAADRAGPGCAAAGGAVDRITALTTFGLRWPTLKMPKPPRQSMYSLPVDVAIGVRPGVGPLDDGAGAFDVGRLAVFEEARIDVVAKRLDRFARDPGRVVGRDRRLGDQV